FSNQPIGVMNRWKNVGDSGVVQRFTQSGVANSAYQNSRNYSDAAIVDASFIRLNDVSVAYNLSGNLIKTLALSPTQGLIQAQHFLTITDYTGADPEIQTVSTLPPIKMLSVGVSARF